MEDRGLIVFPRVVMSSIHAEVLEVQAGCRDWADFAERILERYSFDNSLRLSKKAFMDWVDSLGKGRNALALRQERIKRVTTNTSLRDPAGIGHRFIDEMLQELKIGRGGFLLPVEENQFRRMLERLGKAFAFSPVEIGCVNPTVVEPMVIFMVPHMPWSLKPIPMLMELLT